jgi:hypothetical protein
MPGEELRLRLGGGALGALAGDGDGALRPEAVEPADGLDERGHDWLVVIGVTVVLLDELLLLLVELDEEAARFAVVLVFAVDGVCA